MSMIDVVWGSVNHSVIQEADRLLQRFRIAPAFLIKEATALGSSPQPGKVAELLNAAGLDFVISGAHALAVHTRDPRATANIVVVVSDVPKAVAALRKIQRGTQVLDLGQKIGKRIANVAGKGLVDVLLPIGGVRGDLFKSRIQVSLDGQPASVPALPAMLALKWLAMFSPSRSGEKQVQDKADFLQLIKVHPTASVTAAAKLVYKASPRLAKQLLFDMQQYKKTGSFKLCGESTLT